MSNDQLFWGILALVAITSCDLGINVASKVVPLLIQLGYL